jgi:hypothetical protein
MLCCYRSIPFLAVCSLLACGPISEPGSVSMSFSWDETPDQPVWIWLQVEDRSSGLDVAGTILSSAGPGEYVPGEGLELKLPEVPNGDDRVVVVEVRSGPTTALPVLYYGLSEPFSMAPDKLVTVEIPLSLQKPESDTHVPELLLLFNGDEQLTVGEAQLHQASLETRSAGAVRLVVANDASFTMAVTEFVVTDLGCQADKQDGISWELCSIPWDLGAGSEEFQDGSYSVYVKFIDKNGYESQVYKASATLDLSGPVAMLGALSPSFAAAGESVLLTVTFHEALADDENAATLSVTSTGDQQSPVFVGPKRVAESTSYLWTTTIPDSADADGGIFTFSVMATDRFGNSSPDVSIEDENGSAVELRIDTQAPVLIVPEPIGNGETVHFGIPGETGAEDSLDFEFYFEESNPPLFTEGEGKQCEGTCPVVRLGNQVLGSVLRDEGADDPGKERYGFSFHYDVEMDDWGDIDKELDIEISWSDQAGNSFEKTLSENLHFDFIRPETTECILAPNPANSLDLITFSVNSSEPLLVPPELSVVALEGLFSQAATVSGGKTLFTWTQPAADVTAAELTVGASLVDEVGNRSDGLLACETSILIDNQTPVLTVASITTLPQVTGWNGQKLLVVGDQATLRVEFVVEEGEGLGEGYPLVEMAVPGAPVSFDDIALAEENGSELTYEALLSFSAAEDGEREGSWPVRIILEDIAGNAKVIEPVESAWISVDFTPPQAQCSLAPGLESGSNAYGIGTLLSLQISSYEELQIDTSALDFEFTPAAGAPQPSVVSCENGTTCWTTLAVVDSGTEHQFTAGVRLTDLAGNQTPPGETACLDGLLSGALDGQTPVVDEIALVATTPGYENPSRPLKAGVTVEVTVDVDNTLLPPSVLLGKGSLALSSQVPEDLGNGLSRWIFTRTLDGSEGEGVQAVQVSGIDEAGNGYDGVGLIVSANLDFTAPTASCMVFPELAGSADVILVTVTVSESLLEGLPEFTSDLLFIEPDPDLQKTMFEYSHAVDTQAGDLPDWSFEVQLTDLAGNTSGVDSACSGSGDIDITSPSITGDEEGITVTPKYLADSMKLEVSFSLPDLDLAGDPVVKVGNYKMTADSIVAGGLYSFSYLVDSTGTPPDQAGIWPVSVSLTDKAGNQQFYSPGSVTFDFTAPQLAGATSGELGVPANCPLETVSKLGFGGDISLSFTLDELALNPPSVELMLDEQLIGTMTLVGNPPETATTFNYTFTEGVDGALPADTEGTITVQAEVTDKAQNGQTIELWTVSMDTVRPQSPDTLTPGRITYTRIPWGSESTLGNEAYFVQGDDGAAGSGETILAYNEEIYNVATLLGLAVADGDGSFGAEPGEDGGFGLSPSNRTRVFLVAADDACNLSDFNPATPAVMEGALVRTGELVATMGKKLPGSSAANPSVFTTTRWMQNGLLQRDSIEPDNVSLLGTTEGDPVTVAGGYRWEKRENPQYSPLPSRIHHRVAYDTVRQRLVLFGGEANGIGLADTWEFDGTAWEEKEYVDPEGDGLPAARSFQAMAYDPVRERVVMFGGKNPANDSMVEAETWEWDGTSWALIVPADPEGDGNPPPIQWTDMAWFDDGGYVLLHSGDSDTDYPTWQDMWKWDGNSWEMLFPSTESPYSSPGYRFGHGLAADPVSGKVLMTGGRQDGSKVFVEGLFEWDGIGWKLLVPEDPEADGNPSQRLITGWFYDPMLDGMVLFAGEKTSYNQFWKDNWLWNGTSWEKLGEVPTWSADGFAVVKGMVVTAYETTGEWISSGGSGTSWQFDQQDWTAVEPPVDSGHPPVLQRAAAVYDAARGEMVVYGGHSGGYSMGETWAWNGRRWRLLAAADPTNITAPSRREYATAAYDPDREVMVLFGGWLQNHDTYDETWEWDGIQWTQIIPDDPENDGNPPAMAWGSMTWDSDRQVMVMFSGVKDNVSCGGSCYNPELWEYDGISWERRNYIAANPYGRKGHALVYDPVEGSSLMYGGLQGMTPTNGECWKWDGIQWHKITMSDPEEDGNPVLQDIVGIRKIMMTWDSNRELIMQTNYLFGNGATPPAYPELWLWTGQSWEFVSDLADPEGDGHATPTAYPAMAFDSQRDRLVVFGGAFQNTEFNETWEMDWGTSVYPGAILGVPLSLSNIESGQIQSVETAWKAEASSYDGAEWQDGISLLAWKNGIWQTVGSSDLDQDEDGLIRVEWPHPDVARQLVSGSLAELNLAVRPIYSNGPREHAGVSVSYAETTVTYAIEKLHLGWEFNTTSSEDWSAENIAEAGTPTGGTWQVMLTDDDPGLESPKLEVTELEPRFLKLRVRNENPDCTMRLRFCPGYGGYYPLDGALEAEVSADGEWQVIYFDLQSSSAYEAEFHRLWLDLCLEPSGELFEVDYIQFTE